MAVKIKLKRFGKIRQAQYRIIVADARTKRDGRAIEEIGLYHPKEDPSRIEVDSARAQYWLSVGAQPTERVETILKVTGDWQRFKGEPGADGTLRTASPRVDRAERYNTLLAEAKADDDAAPRRSGRRSAPAAASAPAAPAPAASSPAAPAPAQAPTAVDATDSAPAGDATAVTSAPVAPAGDEPG